jgi:hypothetical protein
MKCKFLGVKGTWREVANAANTTINKDAGEKEPSSSWKRRMLLAAHSPIRKITISAKWYDLKYFVSVHLVRHNIGIHHFVRTQRSDRTGTNRDELPQGSFVEHEIEANAEAIINISRKRLCFQSSRETREAWQEFLESFSSQESELYSVCVRECTYRNGFCPEFKSCGYNRTENFQKELEEYKR